MAEGDLCRFGVLTASDRASAGDYDDLSGPAIVGFLEEAQTSPWEVGRLSLKHISEPTRPSLLS